MSVIETVCLEKLKILLTYTCNSCLNNSSLVLLKLGDNCVVFVGLLTSIGSFTVANLVYPATRSGAG